MTKQPEALRLADVLIGSPQFTGTPIWQAADMLRRQHAEITALRNALEQPAVEPVAWRFRKNGHWAFRNDNVEGLVCEPLYTAPQAQPAVEPEKTNAKESNADLDFCSNAASNEQRRHMVREVEMGRSLGNGQNQSTGNSEPQGAVAVITGFDEYGPFIDWHTHWVNLPVGARLYTAPQAQQPKVEPDNLKCKSVQKRLATLWGYVEAQQPTGWLRAIDEEMVSTHLGVADATDSYEDAKRKLNELICWHVDVSHDPKVNGKQPQLLTDELAACHKDAARYQWLVEYFVGDRTDLDDAIVGASEIGVEQVTAVIDAAMESK